MSITHDLDSDALISRLAGPGSCRGGCCTISAGPQSLGCKRGRNRDCRHHGDPDTRTGGSELIENGLVRRNDVIELFDTLYESQFPEPERAADDQQFGVGPFVFQPLQKCNEPATR